ncbi:MAG TPA: glycosyltransferase family 2 protein [Burkholderiales bacterium]|nr:glycosyltransferase family 2 protein [Burkholderiales bacterium]
MDLHIPAPALQRASEDEASDLPTSVRPALSVTVPVFNEVESVAILHRRVANVLDASSLSWELVFVNDGSNDGSAEELDRLAVADERVKVVHLRRNSGQTAAMMAGFDYARGDIIIPMDGDLQNDPADIPRFLQKLEEGFDVVSGWRLGRQDAKLTRNFPSWLANRLISVISGVHLHDYGCSLKAYRRHVLEDVKLYGEMHRFVPIYASWQGAKVTEIPVTHHARQFGRSKYGLERTGKVILDLIVVSFLAHYAQKPMYVFGSVGLASLAVSGVTGVWALYLKFAENISFIQTPLPLLFVLTAMTGMMCILMGLLAEILTRTYHESQDKSVYSVAAVRNTFRERRRAQLPHSRLP